MATNALTASVLDATPSTPASDRPLRMRTAPGDIRQAVISGTLGDVCALLEQLALAQENTDAGTALTLH